jgi:NAD(P)-dependent dehydrogenase (short-subunit alcohol dehydrogenase family)
VSGKVIVITGASRGIGAATARLAGAAGFAVCVNHRDSAGDAKRVAAELAATGAKVIVVQADVARESEVVRLFETTDGELGAVDALVNNAGFTGPAGRRIENIDAATLHGVFDTNVIGSMLCAREAIRRMSTRHGGHGGHIINVSSTATRMGSPNDWVDYAASKGAIDVFTQGLAREVAEEGIRVNAVAPGLIDTELHARAGEPDRPARYLSQIPMKRAGTAEEVAQTMLWLLTQAPAYIAGALVPISGGR